MERCGRLLDRLTIRDCWSPESSRPDPAMMNLDELAADLEGIGEVSSDLTNLRHVRSRAEIEAAEEIANRKPCADFEKFRPLFKEVQADLKNGIRAAFPFNKDIGENTDARIRVGDFYILGGQFAYVAEMGELHRTAVGAPQARLRVIFGNGTESNLLLRSLQAALYKDEAGRRITKRNDGPLFADQADVGESGHRNGLRPPKQVGPSRDRHTAGPDPQDRRYWRRGAASHRERQPGPDLSTCGCRSGRQLRALQYQSDSTRGTCSIDSSSRRGSRSR